MIARLSFVVIASDLLYVPCNLMANLPSCFNSIVQVILAQCVIMYVVKDRLVLLADWMNVQLLYVCDVTHIGNNMQ